MLGEFHSASLVIIIVQSINSHLNMRALIMHNILKEAFHKALQIQRECFKPEFDFLTLVI